jgi:hypothetical protein
MKQGGSSTATVVSEKVAGHTHHVTIIDEPTHTEEVDSKLDEAREQLLTLRRQQEELERQKADLEELRRKQEEYSRGKTEMIESLTRALATLEREQIQAQRIAELCESTTDAFRDYLEQLRGINDTEWSSENVRTELSRALGIIENSRLEYNRARIKLDCLNPKAGQPETPAEAKPANTINWTDLSRYALLGAAASAPLILAGTIWVILLLAIKH